MKDRERKVEAFYKAALFLKDHMENYGWKKFRSNFLREYAACAFGIPISKSESPELLDDLRREHPELAPYIVVRGRKK